MPEPQTTFCINCGYNLRGVESRRCPECGADNSEEQVQQRLKALMVDPFVGGSAVRRSIVMVLGLALTAALSAVTFWLGAVALVIVLLPLILHNYRQAQRFELADRLIEDCDELRPHMTIFVDGVPVRDRRQLSDPVRASAEVYIMQALSGG